MNQEIACSNANEEIRLLRKKFKRIEDSRSAIKTKSREKGKTIKAFQDRQTELQESRNQWKAMCKGKEKEIEELKSEHQKAAKILKMELEKLQQIIQEVEMVKKNLL